MSNDMTMLKSELDPVPVFLSVFGESLDSDAVAELATAAGLNVNLSLSTKEGYSNRTRLRALLPRIQSLLGELTNDERLRVIAAWTRGLPDKLGAEAKRSLVDRLRTIGWELSGERLVPASQEARELFFGQGETHTAWVEIARIAATVKRRLVIIDGYLDQSLFDLLKLVTKPGPVEVRVITREKEVRQNVADFDRQLWTFTAQYTHLWITIIYDISTYHDRFLVADDDYYHLGASIKDAGKRIFMISQIETPTVQRALEESIATFDEDTP